jgi:hypothetical protein
MGRLPTRRPEVEPTMWVHNAVTQLFLGGGNILEKTILGVSPSSTGLHSGSNVRSTVDLF